MSRRPKPAPAAVYVDIIPAELRAQYVELESKHSAIILAAGPLSGADWAELARIKDALANLLLKLHKLFYEADALVSDVMLRAHVSAHRDAETNREHAAELGGAR